MLFAASDEVSADGTSLPHATEPVALTMDDEVQWRCAGYIQAEIERHVESLEEEDGPDEGEEESSEDEGSQAGQEGAEEVVKKKTKRTRKLKVPETTDEGNIFHFISINFH